MQRLEQVITPASRMTAGTNSLRLGLRANAVSAAPAVLGCLELRIGDSF